MSGQQGGNPPSHFGKHTARGRDAVLVGGKYDRVQCGVDSGGGAGGVWMRVVQWPGVLYPRKELARSNLGEFGVGQERGPGYSSRNRKAQRGSENAGGGLVLWAVSKLERRRGTGALSLTEDLKG